MPKQEIRSEQGAPPVGPYSQGIRAGDFVFVSGQVPIDPASREIVGTTIEEQTERVLENVRAVLEAAGVGMADVVKTTVHLSDLGLFARFNKVYGRAFPDPKPARTTVGSMLPGAIMVEIDVVALVP
jgi:2-iminobutanoate/2-iminopropanoate deaminase